MADACKECGRLRRAREAAAQQLQALHLENESLARQVNELTEALQQRAAGCSTDYREAHPDPSEPSASRRKAATAVPSIDVWAEGDNVAPTRVLLTKALSAYGKQLAVVATLPSIDPARSAPLYFIAASADRHIRVVAGLAGDRAGDSPTTGSISDASSIVATVAHGSPALTLAVLPPLLAEAEQPEFFVSGHMDGAIVMWELTRIAASACSPSVRIRAVSEHPGAHAKFVTRLSCASIPSVGPILLSASTDGIVIVWTIQRTGVEGGSTARLCQLQRLAFAGPVGALAWGPPIPSSPLAAGEIALQSVVLSVEGAPYLYYITLLASLGSGEQVVSALQLNRVPLSEDGIVTDLLHPSPGEAVQISAGSRLPVLRPGMQLIADVVAATLCASTTELASGPLEIPVHHPDAASVHLPISGVIDVLPVGFSIVDMASAGAGRPSAATESSPGSRQLLAAATSTGLVLVYEWGSNRVLRRFAGHLRFTSPTYTGGSSSGISTSSLRVQWYPVSAPPQYLLASTDAGDDVAVFGFASQRVLRFISGAGIGGGTRTILRTLEVLPATAPHEGDRLLTLDNSSNIIVRGVGLLSPE